MIKASERLENEESTLRSYQSQPDHIIAENISYSSSCMLVYGYLVCKLCYRNCKTYANISRVNYTQVQLILWCSPYMGKYDHH